MSGWDLYCLGMKFTWPFVFDEKKMKTFSTLSGDYHPIHLEKSFARSKGFDAPIIYGLLLSSQMSRLIGEELPDEHALLTGIKMDFLHPCLVNDSLIFHAELFAKSDATQFLEFKCKILNGEITSCRGTVSAIWRP